MRFLLIAVLWLAAALTVQAADTQSVDLTAGERAFLQQHPSITLASGVSFDPFTIEEANGRITGFDADIARLIQDKTGLEIRFARGIWKEIQQRAKARALDGLSSAVMTDERAHYYVASAPYTRIAALVLTKKGRAQEFRTLESLRGKRIAIQTGNAIQQILRTQMEQSVLVHYDTFDEILRALVSAEVDVAIGDETIFYIANKIGLSGMIEGAFTVGDGYDIHFLLRSDQPELLSIVNKGLAAISETEFLAVRRRWFSNMDQRIDERADALQLSAAERRYLEQRTQLRVCLDAERSPYAALNEQGVLEGILPDYVQLLSQKLASGRLLAVDRRSGRCDLDLSETHEPGERATTALVRFPFALATSIRQPRIDAIDAHPEQTFAVRRGSAAEAALRQHYPSLRLKAVDSIDEGILRLEQGDIFAYIDTTFAIARTLQEYGISTLKIGGQLPLEQRFTLGAPAEERLLINILQKLVGAVDARERKAIEARWISVRVEQAFDYWLIAQYGLPLLLLLILMLCWNRRLGREVRARLAAEAELKEAIEQLRALSLTDALTQIPNRRQFDSRVRAEWNRACRNNQWLTVALIDIDQFKAYNDHYGHQAGDHCLQQIAATLAHGLRRSSDFVGRYGGEEFVLVIPEADRASACALAENIRAAIAALALKHPSGIVTASIGVASTRPGIDEDVQALIHLADQALYRAKEGGRNRVCCAEVPAAARPDSAEPVPERP